MRNDELNMWVQRLQAVKIFGDNFGIYPKNYILTRIWELKNPLCAGSVEQEPSNYYRKQRRHEQIYRPRRDSNVPRFFR